MGFGLEHDTYVSFDHELRRCRCGSMSHLSACRIETQQHLVQALNNGHRFATLVHLMEGPVADRQVHRTGAVEQRAGMVERGVLEHADQVRDRLAAHPLRQHLL